MDLPHPRRAGELAARRREGGEPQASLAALRRAVSAHPTRESLREELMQSLHAAGRTAEAVTEFADLQQRLAEELGTDPGPRISALHLRLLRGEQAAPGAAPAGPVRPPRHLPPDLPDFTGRAELLQRLAGMARPGAIVALDGMPGVGKTSLALHLAHTLADAYPDGQLHLDLLGHSAGTPLTPTAALGSLLRLVGLADAAQPDDLLARSALWRSSVAGRRLLLVLDNALDEEVVRPLLPASTQTLVVLTSRQRLQDLDAARFLTVDVLPDAEARELFRRVLATGGATTDEPDEERATLGVDWCAGLPLAIRLVAGRLAQRPDWHLDTGPAGADEFRRSLLHHPGTRVHRVFDASLRELDAPLRRALLLVAASPMTDFDPWATAALTATAPEVAAASLEHLADLHLLDTRDGRRYRCHDLVREFAADASRPAPPDPQAADRLYGYFLAATAAAIEVLRADQRRFTPTVTHPPAALPPLADRAAALAWFEAEHRTLLHLATHAEDWQLGYTLGPALHQRGLFADWRACLDHAATRTGNDPFATGMVAVGFGSWFGAREDHASAIREFSRAAQLLTGHPALLASAYSTMAMHLHLSGRDEQAATTARQALAIEHGNVGVRAMSWCNLALATGRLGQADAALGYHGRAIETATDAGAPNLLCAALLGQGETSLRLGRPAADAFVRALRLAEEQPNLIQIGLALDGLAHATGDRAHWERALAVFTELGVPQAGLVRRHLDEPDRPHCDLCAGRPATPAS